MQAKALYAAFKQLNSIVPSESKLRIHDEAMSCVRIICDGKQTTIAAYNLDGRWKRIVLPPEPTTFEVLCPFYLVKKWLRAVARTCEQVWINAIATGIEFTSDTFRYTFSAPGVERYPVMPDERRSPVVAPAPEPKDAIVPFTRPIRVHPEVGTLEPESSEATVQLLKQLAGEVKTPMPNHVISLDEIKSAVAVSLRPDQAFEAVCAITSMIPYSQDVSEFEGRYLIIHATEVSGELEDQMMKGLRDLEIDRTDAPMNSILGYAFIKEVKKYTPATWEEDYQAEVHGYPVSLAEISAAAGNGDVWGVILERPMMFSEPIALKSGLLHEFWTPNNPSHSAAFRKCFESDRIVVDIEREAEVEEVEG
ncbi:MAG: hypothetical protein KME15_20050 [Drouetiella hepatica Uher 2000/2452]|jgi:hypothetical protein|uniref:Uncharacterized protein n=1 Tax=Drouetiella hepatica Uher 2000/2452 TaxID=904376 RepID=A0A951QFN7_9CYAN|nr:hypothetical protein [Drouetiella hepatica Uher 2000/2452]